MNDLQEKYYNKKEGFKGLIDYYTSFLLNFMSKAYLIQTYVTDMATATAAGNWDTYANKLGSIVRMLITFDTVSEGYDKDEIALQPIS